MAETEKIILFEADIMLDEAIKETIKYEDEVTKLRTELDALQKSENASEEAILKKSLELKVAQKELNNHRNITQKVIQANNDNTGSISQLRLQLAVVSERWAKLSEDERINTEVGKKLTAQKKQLTEQITKEEKATGDSRRAVGQYKEGIVEALDEIDPRFAAIKNKGTSIVGIFTKLGAVGGLAFAGVAALAAPIVAFFTKSETGAERLERKMAGLNAAFNVLVGELVKGGEKIVGVDEKTTKWGTTLRNIVGFIGSAIPGLDLLLSRTDSITKKMDDASVAAETYKGRMQELEDVEISNITKRAEANQQIAKAKLLYEDETLSIEDRIAALKQSLTLEKQVTDEEIKYQNGVIEVLQKTKEEAVKNGIWRDEDERKLQESIAKRIELQTDSFMKQKKMQSTLNSAEKELRKNEEEQLKKEQEEQEEKLKQEAENQKRMLQLRIEAIKKEQKAKEEYDQWERDRQIINLDNKLAIENEYSDAYFDLLQQRNDKQYEEDLLNAEKTGADVFIIYQKYEKAKQEIEQRRYIASLSLYSQFAGNIATIAGKNTKVGKMAASAQTAIDTYTGAISAYKSLAGIPYVGPVLGAAAAAAVGVAGAKAIQNIWAVKSGLPGDGGGGTGTGSTAPSGGASVNPSIGQGIVSRSVTQTTNELKVSNQPTLVVDDVTNAQQTKERILKTQSI